MKEAKYLYLLELADDSAILGQRLGEWCGHGPALELDMALTNISLDLFGQARSLYQYAAEVEGKGRSEDDICFLRKEHEFRNCLLVELPNGDFADTILRQYLFDAYQYELYLRLSESADEQLAGFAQKSLKETVYHRRLSGEWVKRLGDGTDESHDKIQRALNDIWSFTGSLFVETEAAKAMHAEGIGVLASSLKNDWQEEVKSTLKEATLSIPESEWMHEGGRSSIHTEHLGYLLAEMQMMQRTYPGQQW